MHFPLPIHARTGLAAIGFRKPRAGESGPQPIWPVKGGSQPEGEPTTPPANTPPPAQPPVPTPAQVFPPQQQPSTGSTDTDLAALNAAITELGLTPAQIRGRLEASRKWEDRAKEKDPLIQALKDKADRFDEMQAAAMTEQEKAVAAARQEGRAATLAEVGGQMVDQFFRASLHNRLTPDQINALVAPLDRKSFLTSDGLGVDTDRVTAFVNVVAPPVAPATTPAAPAATPPATATPATGTQRQVPDMGQGNRTVTAPSGLAAGAEVAKARAARRIAPPVIAK